MSAGSSRVWLARLAQAALSLGLFAAMAEVTVRVTDPTPRAQVIRGGDGTKPFTFPMRDVNGQPVWEHPGSDARQDPPCADDPRGVLLIGSSIFWGTGVEADEAVSHHLQADLTASDPRWCVNNEAQPGFQGFSKVAIALEQIALREPEVVIWEVWANDPGGFTRIGDDAYGIDHLVRDSRGVPVLLPFLPEAWRGWLFEHSTAWEYAALALAPRQPGAQAEAWVRYADEALPAVWAQTQAHGGRLVLAFMPWLDRPFAQSAEEHRSDNEGYRRVRAWADQAGVPWVDVAEAWRDQQPEALRHDPCCHYNPQGHAALAKLLAPLVLTPPEAP